MTTQFQLLVQPFNQRERKRDSVSRSKEVADLVIWTLDMQEFVLFVLGGVLELLSKFSLHIQAYSAHLDP
jgi:hypothetical protein